MRIYTVKSSFQRAAVYTCEVVAPQGRVKAPWYGTTLQGRRSAKTTYLITTTTVLVSTMWMKSVGKPTRSQPFGTEKTEKEAPSPWRGIVA